MKESDWLCQGSPESSHHFLLLSKKNQQGFLLIISISLLPTPLAPSMPDKQCGLEPALGSVACFGESVPFQLPLLRFDPWGLGGNSAHCVPF